jgi:hypothetical protein
MLVVQPAEAVPATPAREGRRVHFSPVPGAGPTTQAAAAAAAGGTQAAAAAAAGTRTLRHRHGHQSQTGSQADDPFIGQRGNIMADTQVQFIFSFLNIFLKFITG